MTYVFMVHHIVGIVFVDRSEKERLYGYSRFPVVGLCTVGCLIPCLLQVIVDSLGFDYNY